MPSRIEDYALIGDCQTAALVGRDGSIDWFCAPSFDSPACFAALLGTPEHGRWLITPVCEPRSITRRYRGDSLVLETLFETSEGTVALIDCMPLANETEWPQITRVVQGRSGRVRMRMELVIRFDYGQMVPWVTRQPGGIRAIAGPDTLLLYAELPLRGENMHTLAEFTVEAGAMVPFVLSYHESHAPERPPAAAWWSIQSTEERW